MTRQELTAVRDVIDALLRCPDHVRELLTQWIAPEARWLAPQARSKERTVPLIFSKPNGRDPHPPPTAPISRQRPAKARHSKLNAKTAERRLLEVMQGSPGLSVIELARAVGGSKSSVGEQLRQLARDGTLEKDAAGHWRLKGEAHPDLTLPPSP